MKSQPTYGVRVYPAAYAGTFGSEPYWLEAGPGSDSDWRGEPDEAKAEALRLRALEPVELPHGHYGAPAYRALPHSEQAP